MEMSEFTDLELEEPVNDVLKVRLNTPLGLAELLVVGFRNRELIATGRQAQVRVGCWFSKR